MTNLLFQESGNGFFAKRFGGFLKSWKIYFSHEVRNAGIGLACLYMTVLGFDSITMGYAYSQGVPESILGILLAVGAAVGLLGSVVFPFLVRCMGVERTGDFSYKFMLPCILELFVRMRFNFLDICRIVWIFPRSSLSHVVRCFCLGTWNTF